jgi:macrodomain Ter protein organizer (MatP/YcbG family)
MRDPNSQNPRQQSIYVHLHVWAAAKELASRAGLSISGWIVGLIERERAKHLGKDWKPK